MKISNALRSHLQTGVTTLCRCWVIQRQDGQKFGFTDHDCRLVFDDTTFQADTGLTASALQQGTGLSIDNAEAMGALSAASVTEADIEAGRFDEAEVTCWVVNWADPDQRAVQFRGHLGEIERAGGAFRAELRGLTDQLNVPRGRVYQKPCAAVLGDQTCRFDLALAGYRSQQKAVAIEDNRVFTFADLDGFEEGWFRRGAFTVMQGDSAGLTGIIKSDRQQPQGRVIELWAPLRGALNTGDQFRLDAGCDKRFETCRFKFNNVMNFQGFPDIPGDDWTLATPATAPQRAGDSRR